MKSFRLLRCLLLLWLFGSGLLLVSLRSEGELPPSVRAAHPVFWDAVPSDPQIPSSQMLSPEQLSQMLKSQKPLVLQVGPRFLYEQAHIPGAEYIGAASTPEGLDALRARVKALPKDKAIVLYCGCCPWSRCPNMHPAYKLLRDMGYGNARVLYIAENLGADWVNKGYPVEKGE
jgi:rhodanese-related sulfurtransferase